MTRGISFAPAIALVVEHRQCSPRAGAHRPALHRSAGTPAKDSPSCPWWASPLEPASCLAASRLACSRSSCGGVTKPRAATETAQQASDRGRVVGFASVGDLHGGDSGADIRNLVENAVLPDGDAPDPLSARTCEQLRARRSRLVGQRLDGVSDPVPRLSRERLELASRARRGIDRSGCQEYAMVTPDMRLRVRGFLSLYRPGKLGLVNVTAGWEGRRAA